MGFDLIGKAGNNFHANVWSWRPIVSLIYESGILSREELVNISFNDGHFIDEKKAHAIADYLNGLIIPDVIDPSFLANHDLWGVDSSVMEEWPYLVTKEHLKEFINFCRKSKGFSIF